MPKCALPYHMKDKKHKDWPWPFSKIDRSWNAYGPRCARGSEGHLPWPPRLVKGKGVARWESAAAYSIIEIPELADKTISGKDFYGRDWWVIERRNGHPDFGLGKRVYFPRWSESVVTVEIDYDREIISVEPDAYSPSALQKFSPCGYMKLDPSYYAVWKILKKKETHDGQGEDTVLFARSRYRPDHLDLYYNKSIIVTGGLHWE